MDHVKRLLSLLLLCSVSFQTEAQTYYNQTTALPSGPITVPNQPGPLYGFNFPSMTYDSSYSAYHGIYQGCGYAKVTNATSNTVACFGEGEAAVNAANSWGGNFVGIASISGANAIALELNPESTAVGATAYGLVIASAGSQQAQNAIQVQGNQTTSTFTDGIVFNYGNGVQPVSGSLITTSGTLLNADYGLKLGGTYNIAELSVPSFGVAGTPGSINAKVLVTGSASGNPRITASGAGGSPATNINLNLQAAGTGKVQILTDGLADGPLTASTIRGTNLMSVPTAAPTTDGGNVPFTLISSGVPFIFNTCTLSATGAISACAAMPLTYANAYMFFNANILAPSGNGSAAGFYYVQMSSTTAGQACLTGGVFTLYSSGSPTIPASCSAPASGVSTPNTIPGTIMQGPTATLAAHSMGKDGSLECATQYSQTNSANLTFAPTTVVQANKLDFIVNAGSEAAQTESYIGNNSTTAAVQSAAATRTTVDTGSSVTISWNQTMNTNTEFVVFERYACKVWPN